MQHTCFAPGMKAGYDRPFVKEREVLAKQLDLRIFRRIPKCIAEICDQLIGNRSRLVGFASCRRRNTANGFVNRHGHLQVERQVRGWGWNSSRKREQSRREPVPG